MTEPNTVPPPAPQASSVPPTVDYASSPGMIDTSNPEARTWAMFCHLAALAGFIIPLGSIIGPLIIWQIKKNEHPFVDDQGKESLNFQITVAIAMIVCFVLVFVIIGFFLLPIVAITSLVLVIIAGIKANGGEVYRYPFAIRFIK